MFCALSQNHQLCVCLPVSFLRGGSHQNMFDVSSGGIKGARGGTPRRNLFPPPPPHLPHLRRKWHKWATFIIFFRETHFPPQCPPPQKKSGVATGCPWLPAQSLCVVSCSVTIFYLDPPCLACCNPCFSRFPRVCLNSFHKIMSNIVFSDVASAVKSRVGQSSPPGRPKWGGKWRKFEEMNEKLPENEKRLRRCSCLKGCLRPWTFSRLLRY